MPATLAMVGGKLTVPTLDGEREVEDPRRRPARRHRARSRASACRRCATVGAASQYVVVDVIVPRKLSRKQRDLAKRLHESLGDA